LRFTGHSLTSTYENPKHISEGKSKSKGNLVYLRSDVEVRKMADINRVKLGYDEHGYNEFMAIASK
jgi:hypothetical protein